MAGISKRRVYAWLKQFNESDLIEDDRHIDIFYGDTDSRQWFAQILELYDFIKETVKEKSCSGPHQRKFLAYSPFPSAHLPL